MENKSLNIIITILVALVVGISGCSKPQEGKQPLRAELGKLAPDFELQDTTGKTWKLSALKGQIVFVNFWATWCPPCREEMPSMQELYKSMPNDKFKMLSILSNDDPTVASNFAAKGGFDFPILIDPDSQIAQDYGLTGVPETYIVDKQGILRQKYLGPRLWSSPEAKKMLMDYVNR
jgi:peroxiredoxin